MLHMALYTCLQCPSFRFPHTFCVVLTGFIRVEWAAVTFIDAMLFTFDYVLAIPNHSLSPQPHHTYRCCMFLVCRLRFPPHFSVTYISVLSRNASLFLCPRSLTDHNVFPPLLCVTGLEESAVTHLCRYSI